MQYNVVRYVLPKTLGAWFVGFDDFIFLIFPFPFLSLDDNDFEGGRGGDDVVRDSGNAVLTVCLLFP